MNDSPLPATFIGLLAHHLAKLCEQLRQLRSGTGSGAAAGIRPEAWVLANRLRAAASALASGRGAAAPAALPELHAPLAAFVAELETTAGDLPVHLEDPCTQLATALEESFVRLDAGDDPAEVAADPGWETVLAAFLNAGTVLQGLDTVEEGLAAWARRYADTDFSRSQAEALSRRWFLLRDYGDSLFGTPERISGNAGAAARPLAGCRVALLVDSPLRRSQLADRLREAGCNVENAVGSDHVADRVADPDPPELVLCDNLEPSRHLIAVRSRLAHLAPEDRPPLVLVAAAREAAERLQERAEHLGARGAWSEPWRVDDLARWLV